MKQLKFHVKRILVYSAFQILFIIAFWPVLWFNPVHHFVEAWREMSHFNWESHLLYQNAFVKSTELPWHYLPVWFTITTPIHYLVLFLAGFVFLLRNLMKNGFNLFSQTDQLLNVLFFFAPVLSVILLHSVVYDAWRHVFFIYIPFLLTSLYGLKNLLNIVKKSRLSLVLVYASFLIFSSITLTTMIKQHPHQYIYFNKFAGTDLSKIKFKYELDYWGLSYKQLYEKMLRENPNDTLYIKPDVPPAEFNTYLLNDSEKARIVITHDSSLIEYNVSTYRWLLDDIDWDKPLYTIEVENAKISGAYPFNK